MTKSSCVGIEIVSGKKFFIVSTFFLSGLGHYNITSVPTKLRGDIAGVNVIQVASYGDCCLAVSDEGDIFGWGNSEYLQLACVTETTQVSWPGGMFLHSSVQRLRTVKNCTLLPALCSSDSGVNQYELMPVTGWVYLYLHNQSVSQLLTGKGLRHLPPLCQSVIKEEYTPCSPFPVPWALHQTEIQPEDGSRCWFWDRK